MSGGSGGRSLVLFVVVLGYSVWSGFDGSVLPSAEAAAATKSSLCDKLPGWCEKQAYAAPDRPRNKIQDKMAETRWRKKKDGDMGGHFSLVSKTERVKPKIEDKLWFRGGVAPRPSRHSEDWKSRLKSELFHEGSEEDMWEVDNDEDYLKVEDESEEEEPAEEGSEEDYEEDDEDLEEEEDEDEEDEEEEEEDSEEEFDEEEEDEGEDKEDDDEEEDASEIPGIFKKRWGFDEEQEEDSEEIIRRAIQEDGKRKMEEEAKKKKAELEQLKKHAESKKKALEEEKRRKINEDRKRKLEEERRRKKEEEEKKKKEEVDRKIEEEEKKRKEEEKKKELEEERRRKINEERKRKVEEEWKKREEEKRLKESEEEKKRQEELKREEEKKKEEEEKRRKINEERRRRIEEEKQKQEEEERRKIEEEEAEKQRQLEEEKKKKVEEERIRQGKEDAKKKLEEEKRRKQEEEEAERKRTEEEKKEEARKEAERIKREEEKRKLEENKRRDEEKKREEEERKKEEERRRKEENEKEEERKKKEEEKQMEDEKKNLEAEKKKQEEKEKKRVEDEKKKKEGEKKKQEGEERKQLEEEKKKRVEDKKKQKEEEMNQIEKERLADKERKKKDEAEKAKQKPAADAKVKKDKKETEVKEQKEKKREKDTKLSSKREDAKPAKSKAKSKSKGEKIPISEWSPDFPEFFAPTANDEVHNEECKKQSRIYVQHLRRMRTWALQMYDATAKLPSGILSGNVNQLGDFDECLAVDVHLRARGSTASADTSPAAEQPPEENGTSVGGLAGFLQRMLSWGAALVKAARGAPGPEAVHITGRYCLASVDIDALPDPRRSKADHAALHDAVQRALSYRFLRGSINDTQHFIPRFSTVSWALCVPAVCSARDVEDGLLASIRNWELGDESWGRGKVRLQLAIPADACRVAPHQPAHKRLPPSFYFVTGGIVLLALLALTATFKDHGEADEDMAPERRMLIAFSLRRSWAVLSAPDDAGAADIHCMHGLRAVCSLALYMAHKVIPTASAPYSNRGKLTQVALSPLSLLLRSSVVYTDTFLLLSGALSSFHFSRELSRTGSLAWMDRYVSRLFRLTPPLLAVLLYYSFVMEHAGNGPRWGPLVEANARLCRKNMWRNLLYIQNFFPFKEMCAPQTHQLALDVQLSLLSAPLVWLLNYSPLMASPVILVLQAASAWLRHRTGLQHRVALLIYHGQKPSELYRAADLSYALAPHRATAYLIGIAMGYALHVIQKPLKLPKLAVIVGWITSAALAGWAIFGLRGAATKDFKFDAQQVATFNAFAPLAWSVAMSWVIMACQLDFGGILGRILCSRVLLLLSRISYAFYLTQFIVFFHNAGSARSQTEFSILGVLDLWEFVTVLAVSTIFTLLIDLPVQAVRAALHHKTGRKEKNNTYAKRSKNWARNNELTWREKEE